MSDADPHAKNAYAALMGEVATELMYESDEGDCEFAGKMAPCKERMAGYRYSDDSKPVGWCWRCWLRFLRSRDQIRHDMATTRLQARYARRFTVEVQAVQWWPGVYAKYLTDWDTQEARTEKGKTVSPGDWVVIDSPDLSGAVDRERFETIATPTDGKPLVRVCDDCIADFD